MTIQEKALEGRTCWIISDGKAGNDVQTRGIANALGLDLTLKRIDPTGIHKFLSPWIGVARSVRFGEPGSTFVPPWPDVAISIGRLTTPYIRELKRRAGPATFTIILQNPKVSLKTADLFWVPEHDKLRADNVITSLTAPHGFSAQRIESLRRSLPAAYTGLKQPRVAIMLGGSNGDYTYSPAALERLEQAIKGLGRAGASLMITPSRRTEKAIIECAERASAGFPRIFWDMTGENPYPHFLAAADVFLAPADSINMTGEPCATGKPVYVFHADGGSPKFARFHKALTDYGATRSFPEPFVGLESWDYAPLNSAASIAAEIAQRYRRAQLAQTQP